MLVWKLLILPLEQESVDVNARKVQLWITTFDNHCSFYAEGRSVTVRTRISSLWIDLCVKMRNCFCRDLWEQLKHNLHHIPSLRGEETLRQLRKFFLMPHIGSKFDRATLACETNSRQVSRIYIFGYMVLPAKATRTRRPGIT